MADPVKAKASDEKDKTLKESDWKFESPSFKCQVCGTQRNDATLEHDPRFWVQSATYPELVTGSKSCPWCEILRTAVERCVGESEDVLGKTGFLDWGRDPFSPVWHASGNVVGMEIFSTQGTHVLSNVICIFKFH
jgi:hypothetical protein